MKITSAFVTIALEELNFLVLNFKLKLYSKEVKMNYELVLFCNSDLGIEIYKDNRDFSISVFIYKLEKEWQDDKCYFSHANYNPNLFSLNDFFVLENGGFINGNDAIAIFVNSSEEVLRKVIFKYAAFLKENLPSVIKRIRSKK